MFFLVLPSWRNKFCSLPSREMNKNVWEAHPYLLPLWETPDNPLPLWEAVPPS